MNTDFAPTRRAAFSPLSILERYGVIVAWVIVIIVFSILRPATFPTAGTVSLILGTQTVILIATLGLMLTLAVGEIDLSVGSVVGFGACLMVVLNGTADISVWVSVLLTIIACAMFGLLNAVLTVIVGVQSIIVTLASGTLLAGITLAVTGAKVVTGMDPAMIALISTRWFGIPIPFYFGVVLTLVLWFVMEHTPIGRRMAFVNANRVVARLAGIRVDRIRMGGLIATATLAGVAGILLAGQNGAANPQSGSYYLLPAFAGAFLGSTTIKPGTFNAFGTWIAVYFLITGITGLVYLGFAGWPEQVFYGASLLVAVSLGVLARRRQRVGIT